jgi:predicted transcriptional regulator
LDTYALRPLKGQVSLLNWKRPDLDAYEGIDLRRILESLEEARVADFMEERIPAVSPDASVRELLYRMISERKPGYVVWRNAPQGLVSYLDALLGFASGRSAKATKVSEIMVQEGLWAVDPDTKVLSLLLWMVKNSVPMVAVFKNEDFMGIFTMAGAFERLVKSAQEVRKAAAH